MVEDVWLTRGRCLLGLVAHLAGLGLIVFVALGLAEDASLWLFGRPAQAEVIATWIEQDTTRSQAEPSYRWFIRYQFTTPDGRAVTSVSGVSAAEFAALGAGRPAALVSRGEEAVATGGADDGAEGTLVDVLYFPPLPIHNRLDASRYAGLLACAYVPLTVAGLVGLRLGQHLLRAA